MSQKELSELIFYCTNNMHDEITELYNALHPDGNPITELSGSVMSKLRMFMHAIKTEKEQIIEAVREYNDGQRA